LTAFLADGVAHQSAGRLDDAERCYQTILAADPSHAGALLHLGTLRLQAGATAEAIALLRAATTSAPSDATTHAALGAALHMAGQLEPAVAAFEEALAADPDSPESHYGLGIALHAQSRSEEAAACHRRALALDPDYPEAEVGLAAALLAMGRPAEAAEAAARAVDADAGYMDALALLATALARLQQHKQALAAWERLAAAAGDPCASGRGRATALRALRRHTEALEALEELLAVVPGDAEALRLRGVVLAETGQMAAAAESFEAAVRQAPASALSWFGLVGCRLCRPGDAALGALSMLLEDRSLPDPDRVLAHFALGRGLTDAGNPAAGFAHFQQANALKRWSVHYDEAAALDLPRRIAAVFTPELMRKMAGGGCRSEAPVFIVGMPRSGSTLVEQMLASHRAVCGIGEQPLFGQALRAAGLDTPARPFPESTAALDSKILAFLGAEYLTAARAVAAQEGRGAAQRIVDKMLPNYCLLGLINLALPDARVIHVRRDPIDSCLSCYAQLFEAEIPYAYDLGELGRAWRACEAVMAHWRSILPATTLLEVDYAALVADPEAQIRRMLTHCALAWDPACLKFHQTERVVATASVAQVRRPLYNGSAQRWRPEREVLRPLLEALAGAA
jgi:tetratricopeptide (TPR) repeat protein